MTPAQFRALALSFPDAHEKPHFDRASFRVGTKIFATLAKDGTAMVKVKPPSELHLLLDGQPEVFFSFGGWTTRLGSLGVRLAKVDPALMKELVAGSWQQVAPAAKRPRAKSTKAKARSKKPAKRRA